jgi:hypothetical protein
MASKITGLFQNRIVGHGEEAPDQLLANPFNARRHPGAQRDVMGSILRELGWLDEVLVNKRSGHVLDGHMRIEIAIRESEPFVPTRYVELDDAEEKLALAVFDRVGSMATYDADTLDQVLAEIATEDQAIQSLLDSLQDEASKGSPPKGSLEVEELDLSEVEDRFWLTARGPLPRQKDALEKLRAALEDLPGVEVDVGTSR